MRKYKFNMVEIMLAIVILALGMATVFVLFPAGMDNHRNAMAENSVADIAELVISRVRAEAALAADSDGFSGAGTFPAYNDIFTGGKLNEPSFDWEDGLSADGWTFRKHTSAAGFYQVRQLSGPVTDPYVDFTAVVAVFKDPAFGNELFVPFKDSAGTVELKHFTDLSTSDLAGDAGNAVKTFDLDDVIIPLVMEISYPANVDYSERKKMYFRFEIFNEKYHLKNSGS
jgi:hypothetical protein